jgi:hypothetical protein
VANDQDGEGSAERRGTSPLEKAVWASTSAGTARYRCGRPLLSSEVCAEFAFGVVD